MKDTALKVSGIVFLFIAIMHLLRLILKIQVTLANFSVPLWFSIFGFIIPLVLSVWIFSLFKEHNENNNEELKVFQALNQHEIEFRIAVYKRYKDMWIHWTPHIWSIPTVAATINLVAYAGLFDTSRKLDQSILRYGLLIVTLLNLALTIGVWRTRYMQQKFGDRLQEIERGTGTPPVKLCKFSASLFYALIMTSIFLINLFVFIFHNFK